MIGKNLKSLIQIKGQRMSPRGELSLKLLILTGYFTMITLQIWLLCWLNELEKKFWWEKQLGSLFNSFGNNICQSFKRRCSIHILYICLVTYSWHHGSWVRRWVIFSIPLWPDQMILKVSSVLEIRHLRWQQ